jgi:hypothetical protein
MCAQETVPQPEHMSLPATWWLLSTGQVRDQILQPRAGGPPQQPDLAWQGQGSVLPSACPMYHRLRASSSFTGHAFSLQFLLCLAVPPVANILQLRNSRLLHCQTRWRLYVVALCSAGGGNVRVSDFLQ